MCSSDLVVYVGHAGALLADAERCRAAPGAGELAGTRPHGSGLGRIKRDVSHHFQIFLLLSVIDPSAYVREEYTNFWIKIIDG